MLVVIPFRAGGKSRLPSEIRTDVALAMLGDVIETAVGVGEARVVTDDPAGRLVAAELGAEAVDDPGEGQGAAVAVALAGAEGVCLVVNADLPRVRPSDLGALAVPARLGGVAVVEAADDERRTPWDCPSPRRSRRSTAGERSPVPRARRCA